MCQTMMLVMLVILVTSDKVSNDDNVDGVFVDFDKHPPRHQPSDKHPRALRWPGMDCCDVSFLGPILICSYPHTAFVAL